jgi:anti-sigma B factor antagonist
MEILRQKNEEIKNKSEQFKSPTKNGIIFEEKLKFQDEMNLSKLFSRNNSLSIEYSILKVKVERATLKEASNFKKFMEKSLAEDERNIIVDLDCCEFIDSSFFGVLVGGLKRLRAMGKRFFIVHDSTKNLPIFSATGLDKVFTLYNTIEEALNA